MKRISILGSTGSIGSQTLDVVREHPDEFEIVALSTCKNIDVLKKQIKEFNPKYIAVTDIKSASLLAYESEYDIHAGTEGLLKIARLKETDIVVNALVGAAGIEPTYEAIKAGRKIALANKEALVAAGDIIMKASSKYNAPIIPIDSEHSAILQCISGEDKKTIASITITCSGGPFRNLSSKEMANKTATDALKHPTWKMGEKITIDSATWMNKGFEVIEAHHLYGLPYDKIKVVVHPQSIIHSLVNFIDGSTLSQMGIPNMRVPIQYALTYPKRIMLKSNQLDLAKIKSLTFEEPDLQRFPCIGLAYSAGIAGGVKAAALNAGNEVAVHAFLDGKIGFNDIFRIAESSMNKAASNSSPSLFDILETDKKTRIHAEGMIK